MSDAGIPAGDLKKVCSWRIVAADPTGLLMWFDPKCEEPLLRSLPPVSEEGLLILATESRELFDREGVVPLEGGAANESDKFNKWLSSGIPDDDLPF